MMGLTTFQLKWVPGLICLTIFFVACNKQMIVPDCKPPAWFFESAGRDGIKTGVGEGANLDEATASAMSEIAGQISIWVSSRSMILAERNGLTSESRFKHQVELESMHRLKNAKRLNMAVCGSRYYVKYSVDLRPPAVVMADALMVEYPGQNILFTGSPAIIGSPFADALRRLMPDQRAELSKNIHIRIPLSLSYTDGIWSVHAGRISLPVSDISDLVDLSGYVTGDVKLGLCDKTGSPRPLLLKTGGQVFFSVPGGEGFYSIFNIYADGRVSVIAANQSVKPESTIFPDPTGRCVLQASTINPHSSSVDVYLLVVSPSMQDMSAFSALHEDGRTVSGDDSFSAHVLAGWLDGIKQKQVAMLKTRTEPR